MDRPRRIGLYGVGHFGYALLRRLDRRAGADFDLRVYDRNDEVRRMLRDERRHPFHEVTAPMADAVEVVDSVAELVGAADTLILAVMSSATREVAAAIGAEPWPGQLLVVNTAKALDSRTGKRLSEVFAEAIPSAPARYDYAALSGGTIAKDMLDDEPLGITIGCPRPDALPGLHWLFSSPRLWVQTTTDLVGVEFSGALKNIIAICAGMARGLGFGYGAETHLISRLAGEAEEFCVKRFGADRRTFSTGSQCWGSDLWMSCTGPTRNRALGELLGQGKSLDEATGIMAAQNKTVEGVQTVGAMETLFRAYPDDLPLMRIAGRVILHDAPPERLIEALMRAEGGAAR